jgi:hypothetical protein
VAGLHTDATAIRADELSHWSAELMWPGVAGLFLYGAAGIGKSVLAAHIADRISSERPGTRVTAVTGPVTVERLAEILVADSPSLVILDQFDANVAHGTIADRGLAAVLMCLAEEIAGRDEEQHQARVIITARRPLALSPHILLGQVGPLTRWNADVFARSLPRLGKLTDTEWEHAWRLTGGNPGSLRDLDARLADGTFAGFADGGTPATDTMPHNGVRKPRRIRLLILSAALVTPVIASAPFAVRPLVTHSAPAAVTVQATRPFKQAAEVTPVVAAATWLAGNVASGSLVGCDPAMCASLRREGVPQADLSPLRPGADLTADSLIVATPRARQLMGAAIATAAPELTASFGAGSGQVDVRQVTPGGAAAYSSLLAADIASRREGGNLILGNASIKATGDNWMLLCNGHVDGRILLALAEIAHSAALTIVSFGTASPGAAAEVPLRSVLIDIADPTAAAAYLKVQNPVMQPLAVRIGQASLWVEYGAPIPLGLFQAES